MLAEVFPMRCIGQEMDVTAQQQAAELLVL